jgi:hypothetical protein
MTGMSYEEFGAAFVHEAVTPARISSVIRSIAGGAVQVGPLRAGPGGVAAATAAGTVAEPVIEETGRNPLSYCVRLPVDLELHVDVGGSRHHYTAEAEVKVGITVRLEPPLSICIDPTPPSRHDVSVRVHAKGLQAKVLGRVGDIDNELRREIAAYVKARVEADGSQFAHVDLRPLMLEAWPVEPA